MLLRSHYGDFLVHRVIALYLHKTTLILVKGVLYVHGSKFMLDKEILNIVSLGMVRDKVVLLIF